MFEDNLNQNIARPELLQIAESVAREKSIDQNIVIQAMEQAIQSAAKRKYGQELEIRAGINKKSGEIEIARVLKVVEVVDNKAIEITLEEGQKRDSSARIGDFFYDPLPPIELGRVAAQTAKQVIVQKVRDAEREKQYEEFKDRVGEVVNGLVKRIEYGNVIVDLGRGEAFIRRDDVIPRETFRPGDRIRSWISEVKKEQRGPQIYLSRTANEFMTKLFTQEVPEIYDGIIQIISVARDPGSRAKISVMSKDNSIDPVGACVGMRGSRVQAVVAELQNEKIDIIPFSEDVPTYLVNALAPAEVTKVVLDEEEKKVEIVVPDDQLSLAIGRRGQNVRLACQLTGWDIDILTEGSESDRRQTEMSNISQLFIDKLNVDEVIAQVLVTEGFSSLEAVAYVPIEDLIEIEGFDEKIAEELRERALTSLKEKEEKIKDDLSNMGISEELSQFEGLTPSMLVKLGNADVKTVDDLADLSSDELKEALEEITLSNKEADEIIMSARSSWFDDDKKEENNEEN
jgi:N utilization substance protein A|tara:strand:- start:525 stop:2069 length:1545 start_codon:yes stop_codon:yes gene_type:complete